MSTFAYTDTRPQSNVPTQGLFIIIGLNVLFLVLWCVIVTFGSGAGLGFIGLFGPIIQAGINLLAACVSTTICIIRVVQSRESEDEDLEYTYIPHLYMALAFYLICFISAFVPIFLLPLLIIGIEMGNTMSTM